MEKSKIHWTFTGGVQGAALGPLVGGTGGGAKTPWRLSIVSIWECFTLILKITLGAQKNCGNPPIRRKFSCLNTITNKHRRYPTWTISCASVRRWAMCSDSSSSTSISSFLYSWETSSLCRLSLMKFTRKCMIAFGIVSWMFLRTIMKYDLISRSGRGGKNIQLLITVLWMIVTIL